MKLILICVLILIVMLIAYSVSEQYKDKYDFYLNLKQFLIQLKLNVSFRQEKLNKFLSNMQSRRTFKIFVQAYLDYLQTNNLDLSGLKLLDDDEKNQLLSIVKNIGNYDSTNQIAQIDGFLQEIEEKLIQAKENKAKMCPMIIKLSLLLSLAVAVLLI